MPWWDLTVQENILDEPTAALDPVTELEIYSKFNECAVIRQGTHEKLVADEGGKYYELWNAQAKYYTA